MNESEPQDSAFEDENYDDDGDWGDTMDAIQIVDDVPVNDRNWSRMLLLRFVPRNFDYKVSAPSKEDIDLLVCGFIRDCDDKIWSDLSVHVYKIAISFYDLWDILYVTCRDGHKYKFWMDFEAATIKDVQSILSKSGEVTPDGSLLISHKGKWLKPNDQTLVQANIKPNSTLNCALDYHGHLL